MYWGEVMAGHMGRGVIEEQVWRKGPWTAEEDKLLVEYVRLHGEGRWNSVARLATNKNSEYFDILTLTVARSRHHSKEHDFGYGGGGNNRSTIVNDLISTPTGISPL
ncbi:Transcription factor MYB2 [Glycine max]|nr:Transcription factor MYB2 [Glycine max]